MPSSNLWIHFFREGDSCPWTEINFTTPQKYSSRTLPLKKNIKNGGKDSSEKYSKWLMRLQWSEQWAAVASGGCGRRVASICHSTETDTFHPIVQNPPKLYTSELTREMQFFCNSHSILLLQVVSF